jgi:hypothetical protein
MNVTQGRTDERHAGFTMLHIFSLGFLAHAETTLFEGEIKYFVTQ